MENDLREEEDDYEEGVGGVRIIKSVGFSEEVVRLAEDIQGESAHRDSKKYTKFGCEGHRSQLDGIRSRS